MGGRESIDTVTNLFCVLSCLLFCFLIHLWIVTSEPGIGKKKKKSHTGAGWVVEKHSLTNGPLKTECVGTVF